MKQQPFDTPSEALEHFGVKGMKWGVRKNPGSKPELKNLVDKPMVRTTKNGDVITLTQNPPGKINKALAKISSNYVKSYNSGAHLDIKDAQGKRVGTASFWLKGQDDIYLNMISIDRSARGRGYATEVLKASAYHGKRMGKKRLLLEVPGIAPDARHIYEKMGFKETGVTLGNKKDVWGGLTEMEYQL